MGWELALAPAGDRAIAARPGCQGHLRLDQVVGEEGLRHRGRVRQAGGLDDHPIQLRALGRGGEGRNYWGGGKGRGEGG